MGASSYCSVRGRQPGEMAAVPGVGEQENPEEGT